MAYTDIKHKIDLLRKQIASHGKLTPEQLKKTNYKFRLEWNYNSNSMEGNTLTIEETRSVMVGNIDVHLKPYKDIAEMKGHDAVVTDILKIGKGELRLSEARIKQIHKSIMYEDDVLLKERIGIWKTVPNQIINHKHEKYDFVTPEDVPEKIHDLLNRTNAAMDAIESEKKNAPHPLDVAFNFHLEYLNIHPFYDGNGRTARILTNLILIALGYPPFWITEKERNAYYTYIADIQGYGGSVDLLNEYMAGLILRSQQLIVDVIEGRDIEADDDLDKEIAVWKRQLGKKDGFVSRSDMAVLELYQQSLRPLFESYLEKLEQFDELFDKKFINGAINSNFQISRGLDYFDSFFNNVNNELLIEPLNIPNLNSLVLNVSFNGFKNDGLNTFSAYAELYLRFEEYKYFINYKDSYDDSYCIKLYSEKLTEEEIKFIVKETVVKLFEGIKASIKS